jgi:glycosyltransferase involved in cell wall biosynthesis
MGVGTFYETMKILYIASADLTGEYGSLGSVRHIIEVSENLFHLGNRVKLIVPNYGSYPHATPVDITYVPLINIRFLRTIISEFLAPFFILAYLICWKPNIIYWRQAYLTIFPVLISRFLGRAIITEVNGLTIDEVETEKITKLRKKVIFTFERFNYRASTHIICVAPQIKERILTHYGLSPEKVSVILNGVNAEKMPVINTEDAKTKIGLSPDNKVIGFVGHFFPWDGIEYLIEAATKIVNKIRNVRFLIIGHGLWGQHLPQLADKRGLTDHFIFTGKVPWERLYNFINAFDIATAPYSKAINLQSGRSSLKILEYFACKKPVVASETEVIPEIVDLAEKGLGLTVQPEDARALADAILHLLENDSLRKKMGQGGRDYVERERSWKIVAQKTQYIMDTLVN